MAAPAQAVDTRLTKVWNWSAEIDGEVQLSSFDRPGVVVPPFGMYFEIEKYHADNLCDRNPGLLTQDESLVNRMVAARNNRTNIGEHVNPLDLFTEEELAEALRARTGAAMVDKPKNRGGRPANAKPETADPLKTEDEKEDE